MDAGRYLSRRVKLVVNEGNTTTVYTGRVVAHDEDSLTLEDKFSNDVSISLQRIIKIEVLNHDG